MTSSVGRVLGATVAVVAILSTISALSMPVPERAAHPTLIGIWLALLSTHAALYWSGERLRQRFGVARYVLAQGLALFAIGVSRPPMPITLALFAAGTVECVLVAGPRWGAIRITVGSIATFVVALFLTSGLYFATTAGAVLALTGVVAHAFAGFVKRGTPVTEERSNGNTAPVHAPNGASALSAREAEVLRELVRGARNSEIAATLGITERTVKSHLKSVFQKMGVESRSAAIARALQQGLQQS